MDFFGTEKKKDFDLEIVHSHFQKSVLNDGNICTQNYLLAYHELCRFFTLTGPIFAFVAKDLEKKIRAIEHHLTRDKLNYLTVQNMLGHEISNHVTHTKSPHPSGCRTLLRLHHALEFIIAFMKRIGENDEDEKISKIAWDIYYKTLFNHHPWMTQKLAAVAVYALPSKKSIIKIMCKQDFDTVMELLKHVSDSGEQVFNIVQDLLETNDLLHIP